MGSCFSCCLKNKIVIESPAEEEEVEVFTIEEHTPNGVPVASGA